MIRIDPTSCDRTKRLFLAGSISGCPDWQAEVLALLEDTALVVYNPRHPAFDMADPAAPARQIAWEFGHLRKADAVLFWFAAETIAPIVLFELGAQLSRSATPLFIGCAPGYARRADVEIQAALARPGRTPQVVSTLPDLAKQVRRWAALPDPTPLEVR